MTSDAWAKRGSPLVLVPQHLRGTVPRQEGSSVIEKSLTHHNTGENERWRTQPNGNLPQAGWGRGSRGDYSSSSFFIKLKKESPQKEHKYARQRIAAMIPHLDTIAYSFDIPNQHAGCFTLKMNQKHVEEKKAKPKKNNNEEEEEHNYSKRGSRSSNSRYHSSSTSIEKTVVSRPPLPATAKRRVVFSKKVHVRRITSYRRYEPEELAAVWYSREGMKEIKSNASSTVRKMMEGQNVDNDVNDCSRGLEFKTPKEYKKRHTRKADIIWTVISHQQEMQERDGETDSEYLADIYRYFADTGSAEAIKRAANDELFAREYCC